MENIKLLFQMYFRPAFAMSEILDKGSWLFAAILVLFISIAFFWTVNAKLQTAYSIPAFYEFYDPDYNAIDEDSPEVQAAYRKAASEYQKALNERRTIPLVGDLFFRFFSFDPTGFLRPVLSLSVFYVPFVILLMSMFGGAGNFGVRFAARLQRTCDLHFDGLGGGASAVCRSRNFAEFGGNFAADFLFVLGDQQFFIRRVYDFRH